MQQNAFQHDAFQVGISDAAAGGPPNCVPFQPDAFEIGDYAHGEAVASDAVDPGTQGGKRKWLYETRPDEAETKRRRRLREQAEALGYEITDDDDDEDIIWLLIH